MDEKVVCFDFDGVISEYDCWKGFDVLGEPISETINVMYLLKEKGYKILILTTRVVTPTLLSWLEEYNVPYDEINNHVIKKPFTSIKPIYHCIVDDRAVNFNWKTNRLTEEQLMEQIEETLAGHGKLIEEEVTIK